MATNKAKLERDIADMQSMLDNPNTPEQRKQLLRKGIEQAKEELKTADKPEEATAKKKLVGKKGKKKGKSSLDNCREIIARYKKQQATATKRLKVRRNQGKPAELTVPETLKKTAKAVKKKVKDTDTGKITVTQEDAAIKQIVQIAGAILQGQSASQRKGFINKLIKALERPGVKAAEGMFMGDNDPVSQMGEPQTATGNIRIESYRTMNFDVCPDAQKLFDQLLGELGRQGSSRDAFTLLKNAANDLDKMLGIVKQVELSGRAHRIQFSNAVAHSMLFMYWLGKLFDRLPSGTEIQNYYPRFLPGYLYMIAMKLPEDTTPEIAEFGTRLRSAVNRDRKYESDQPWEKRYDRSRPPKHPHYAHNGYGFTPMHVETIRNYLLAKMEEAGIDIAEFKRKVAQAKMDLQHGHVGEEDYSGFQTTLNEIHAMIDQADLPSKINYDYDTGEISEDEPSMEQIQDGDWREVSVTLFLVGKDLREYMAKGGKLKGSGSDKIQINPDYRWFAYNPHNNKIVGGYEWNVDAKEYVREMKEVNPFSKLVVYGQKHLKSVLHIDPYNVDNWSNPDLAAKGMKLDKEDRKVTRKRKGETTFNDKVKSITKKLTGQKVPGKYRKQYGKTYNKKEARTAAQKIAGKMRKREKSRKKKAYAGMTLINAPDNFQVKDGSGVLGAANNQ